MPSRRRVVALVALLQLSVIAGAHAAGDENVVTVPFVGCPGDGQVGRVAAPSGKPVLVAVAPKVGAQLAFYKGFHGRGVFAPAGWQCREWYGSNGYFMIVTPAPPPDRITAQPVAGPGVELLLRDGGTSGRFDVAAVSARFFPDLMRDFIQAVRDEGLEPASNFTPARYPKDTVQRIGERMVEFSTPAREAGFGTEGLLARSDQPVRGIVALHPASEETGMTVLRIRLPARQEALREAIVGIETRCLRTLEGCVPPQ